MANLRNLYQEVILDHNKKPRNFGSLEGANRHAHGHNPLCGDTYEVAAIVVGEDGTIEDIRFSGEGCAISKAAASMMTQHVKGKSVDEAEELIEQFRAMLTGKLADEDNQLGHLKVFEGVAQRPERVKCAVLPWHTLHAALEGKEEISTEGDADPFGEA